MSISKISTNSIKEAVKSICLKANTCLSKEVYDNFLHLYNIENNTKAKNVFSQILENAKLACESKRPLCQDTGLVTVFLKIGQNVILEGTNIEDSVNSAVSECYTENFLRKSVVNDPIFSRINTNTNTPVIIHTEIVDGNQVEILLAVKGGGSENMSALKMLKPADGKEGIIDFVLETVKNAGSNPCPPIKIGIGIGGTMEKAAILSKKALFNKIENNNEEKELEQEILQKVNELEIGPMGTGGKSTCYGVNILSAPCHIASLPVAININCHSSRHASATISENVIKYNFEEFEYDFHDISSAEETIKEIKTDDIETLRNLKAGELVCLTGTVYTARDAAHKKLVEMIEQGENLPFQIKDSIVFYAGPCPANSEEVIGPIGPTTSSRMDKYTPLLYDKGLLATIGKGARNEETKKAIKRNNGLYFEATGGIAVLLAQKIKKAELIAFPELGAEAIYKLEIEKIPVTLNIDAKETWASE